MKKARFCHRRHEVLFKKSEIHHSKQMECLRMSPVLESVSRYIADMWKNMVALKRRMNK